MDDGRTEKPRLLVQSDIKQVATFNPKGGENGEPVIYLGVKFIQLVRNFGKAKKCENSDARLGFKCKKISKSFNWAFINKRGFARDREQYIQLCHSCHLIYDRNK
jgi:hypothetical protein